jgi:hypothetical protein
MEILEKKKNLVQMIMNSEDMNILSEIESLLLLGKNESLSKELKPLTLDEFYAILAKAEDDILNGRVITNEDLAKEIALWN